MNEIKLSPERLYIINNDNINKTDENYLKHTSRYKFASMFVNGGDVLDCACGSGYGTILLSQKVNTIYGIDNCSNAIEFASNHNNSNNIVYINQKLQSIDFKEKSLNSIISLETLEHISKTDMVDFLKKSSKLLKNNGCFIGSSPMLRYKDNKPYITNPYHINELPKNELINTVTECFKEFTIYFFHQNITSFTPLHDENTGFCIFVARKIQ